MPWGQGDSPLPTSRFGTGVQSPRLYFQNSFWLQPREPLAPRNPLLPACSRVPLLCPDTGACPGPAVTGPYCPYCPERLEAGPPPSYPACVAESGGRKRGAGQVKHTLPLSPACLHPAVHSTLAASFLSLSPSSKTFADCSFPNQFKPACRMRFPFWEPRCIHVSQLTSHSDPFPKTLIKSGREGDGVSGARGVSRAPFSRRNSRRSWGGGRRG